MNFIGNSWKCNVNDIIMDTNNNKHCSFKLKLKRHTYIFKRKKKERNKHAVISTFARLKLSTISGFILPKQCTSKGHKNAIFVIS